MSGSPLPDAPSTRFYSSLQSVAGGRVSGITHHCASHGGPTHSAYCLRLLALHL